MNVQELRTRRPAYAVCLIGPQGCLSAETRIQYELRRTNGERVNHKGGSIESLYHRFNDVPQVYAGARRSSEKLDFFLSSIDDDDLIFQNQIIGVVDSGEQECYLLKTSSGQEITATADHRFYTGSDYVRLADLSLGDQIFAHLNTLRRSEPHRRPARPRKMFYVKHHPVVREKTIQGRYVGVDRNYTYRVLPRSRAVLEAALNSLALEQFLYRLNTGEVGGLQFLDADLEIHHENEDTLDDRVDNLKPLTTADHARIHASNPRYVATPVSVVGISSVGLRRTYDIQMAAPHHNFIANGLVVHNSGKTQQGCTWPKVYYIGSDPSGLDTIFWNPENAKLASNIVGGTVLNGLPLADVFADSETSESSIYGNIAIATEMAARGEVKTIFLDNLTYLVDPMYWNFIDGDNKTGYGRFGQVAQFASDLVLSRLLPLATRNGINIVIAMHVQRESQDAVEGVSDAIKAKAASDVKKAEQVGGSKRHVNLKGDLSPMVLGSLRQKIGGMPSAMIWLDNDEDGRYHAYCRKQYVASWDTVIEAKNRYGLESEYDITGAGLYPTLVAASRKAMEAQKAIVTAAAKKAASVNVSGVDAGVPPTPTNVTSTPAPSGQSATATIIKEN